MENPKKIESTARKCYNSWSCALSVFIIVAVLGSIVYDFTYSKPRMRKDIKEIKVEVQEIHEKINAQQLYFIPADTDFTAENKE